jgi:alpha-galactosidase
MAIEFLSEEQLFVLNTANTSYAFRLSQDGKLIHSYWGSRLPRHADYWALPPDWQHAAQHAVHRELEAEFPVISGIQEVESCLKAVFSDGTRNLRLVYVRNEISDEPGKRGLLTVYLKDEFYPLEVELQYELHSEEDILRRRVRVRNTGTEAIRLEQILSGSLLLPFDRGDLRLTYLSGAHNMETQLNREILQPGRKLLEARQLITGHNHNPFFAVDLLDAHGQGATENQGEVWYGSLAWSGNWKIVAEQIHVPYRLTRVSAGINDFDFAWELEPGETFETPWLVTGYTDRGFGQMSRNLHRFELNFLLPRRAAQELRPVLYNSWEATEFEVNEVEQVQLAEKAAKMGVELFVLDDGWFGERHTDLAGLGDWEPNTKKFPHGLTPLIEKVNALGMDFGIWVEPEMVNPDSELYRTHPDWVYHFANRPRTTSRNQLILNIARPDVQQHLFEALDRLLSGNNIKYLKWDYNRAVSEPGWPEAPLQKQREVWVRHIQAFYSLIDRLRERHPEVLYESCAGGGGRAELGSLSHFDHVWTSDNTDPFDRLSIQQGYSLAYAPKTMYCWVTQTDKNRANFSLRYRFHSSFMGSLGVGADLNTWGAAELEEATRLIAQYKEIRPVIQNGLFYRLTPLGVYERLAVQYHLPETKEGVILAFNCRLNFWRNREWQRFSLVGLEPGKVYRLEGDLAKGEPTELSGQALHSRGILPVLFNSHFDSAVIRYRQVL